ncbi:hypothetical protein LIER_14130 [Lithospermum erythrorhizon]|uniref:Uncharacterized protein n=1 Tax=Lithospermum erythrorhizon TaxID=34254 RepID=A0AAV3PYF5_LITER
MLSLIDPPLGGHRSEVSLTRFGPAPGKQVLTNPYEVRTGSGERVVGPTLPIDQSNDMLMSNDLSAVRDSEHHLALPWELPCGQSCGP